MSSDLGPGGFRTHPCDPLRIGALGAARITPGALIRPARGVAEATVVAVAARDQKRAADFAKRHGVPRVHEDYEALLADPDIDAVYVPLPNGLHGEASIAALEAGKHVLCEKPMAANADEARAMREAARQSGRLLMEAYHWRYHPVAERLLGVIAEGRIGALRHVEASLCVPLWSSGDIRYRYALAGGALMDLGGYTVHWLRHVVGEEPKVLGASARQASENVDRCAEASLAFPGGVTGRIICSMRSRRVLQMHIRAVGDAGSVYLFNPIAPHAFHWIKIKDAQGTQREQVPGETTYTHQLRAFVRALQTGAQPITDADDAVANMVVLDAIYQAAGMPRREPAAYFDR